MTSDLMQWSPALILLLYVAGFVVANSHYGRFEMVKPTLLAGRYLSAGLLFLIFAFAPATAGFASLLQCVSVGKKLKSRKILAGVVLFLAYSIGTGVYVYVLVSIAVIQSEHRTGLIFGLGAFLTGSAAAATLLDMLDRKGLDVDRASKFGVHLLYIAALAYVFGISIYPSVKPHYGGAAVLKGYVVLKPGSPKYLLQQVAPGPLPFVDLDDRFLYVVGCSHERGDTTAMIIMVSLDLVASSRVRPSPDSLFSLPKYLENHRCIGG